ncbi:MAG: LysM peptidoglycan-binding domain-containing protein [Deltaproteobacteria bacterium]|nr:LysM peptidoglycan-binding domain-containing protein [Deltaproteobacteria bacterium]
MGLWDFVSSLKKKLGGKSAPAAEAAKQMADANARAAAFQQIAVDWNASIHTEIQRTGLGVQGLRIEAVGPAVKLFGTVATQADKEKLVQIVGNHEGVDTVDDSGVTVTGPSGRPSVFHTVVASDTLSLIAKRYYGIIQAYPTIASANQPLIADVDAIEPGWIVRVPAIEGISYTTKSGDTLGSIAKAMYGDPAKYTVIAGANASVIRDPNVVEPGWALTIPVLQALPAPKMA